MAVSTTVLAITGLVVGAAGVGISAYQNSTEADYARADAQAAYAAQKQKYDADWAASKREAEQSAVDLDKQAAQTQTDANKTRNIGTQQLGTMLGQAAGQSIQANKQGNALAGNVSRSNSSVAAAIGASGVKNSGSSAETAKEANIQGTEAIANARDSIFSGIRDSATGAALGQEQIGNSYDASMFNKNAILDRAAQIRTSIAVGGTAYSRYQAGGDYAATINSLNIGAINRQQNAMNMTAPFSILSGAFSGAAMGLSFGESAANFGKNLAETKQIKLDKQANSMFGSTKWNIQW